MELGHALPMHLFLYSLQLNVCECLLLSCQGKFDLRIRIRTRQLNLLNLQNQKYYFLGVGGGG
jgi:hypothetical protein